jgi:hypothetical protein
VDFERAAFRANPGYELVVLDRLTPAELALVPDGPHGEVADEELYGLLRPRPPARLDTYAVSADTALLFLTLAQAGPLPTYVFRRLGTRAEATIARLILDEILEVERDGVFVSGARAAQAFEPGNGAAGTGRIGALSVAALRYGQSLHGLPEPLLATRLYCYGRKPIHPELQHRFPTGTTIAIHLGLAASGAVRVVLDAAGWVESSGSTAHHNHWWQWQARPAPDPGIASRQARYKLYLSPAVEALPTALEVLAAALVRTRGVQAFKVGADLAGISRPDKLIAYFEHIEDLYQAADRLSDHLAGCPAHGVPFTATITSDGLLSWGADPPATRTSWRMWVAARLAEYLTLGRATGGEADEPWRFALQRLRLSGIDTETWVPTAGMWPDVLRNG